jgi:hypothetical protein
VGCITIDEKSLLLRLTSKNNIRRTSPFLLYEIFNPTLNARPCEPGSSVSIVSGSGLDNQAIEVRTPAEAEDFFSSFCVQTGSGAHPASCIMGTGDPFPGVKRSRGVTLTTHPI